MAECSICKRELGDPADELSRDCGGDCLGCVADAEWPYDAILRNWSIHEWADWRCVVGTIYADKKGRFEDGRTVRTSYIRNLDGQHLITANTRYLLVGEEMK